MYKLLIVEDDQLIGTTIRLNLEKAGYQVSQCVDAETMLKLLADHYFDLILLDIMLPGLSGQDALRRIRDKNINTPVIMVSARSDTGTKVDTLTDGADDYVSKPFVMKELIARIQALIRRSQGERTLPSSRIMHIGEYTVDLEKRIASTTVGDVTLSEKEVKLLTFFNTHPQETLSRADILEEVWGMDADPTPRTIDNYIVKFRRLFEETPESPTHFISVRAKGYRFLR